MTPAGPPARRGVLVAEITALVVATVVDSVLVVRQGQGGARGVLGPVLAALVPYVGTAVAVLAVLRRRFPDRVALLGWSVIGFSLISTGAAALVGAEAGAQPVATEVLGIALLAGAGCRRLPPVAAAVLAVAAGAAVVAAPVVRYGVASPVALAAVPAALLWGTALAFGLVLRDADARHVAALDRVREGERLQLARELHDLVAHHVSGIVVLAQAAHALAENPAVPDQDPVDVYREVEQAGAEALTSMRRLVGMLRSDPAPSPPDGTLGDAVRAAADGRADVVMSEELDATAVPSDLAGTVNRIVLESMTNVRRHAPNATEVVVGAHTADGHLVLEIRNDGASGDRSGGGYGLVGMAERVTALGGSLHAGPEPGHRWRTTARLPLRAGEGV
ncbi:sensor histidine kinase [Umezawaea endophytica]|uniref:histidine kinase n=1 Tax=Umezawaea endophytica TaxID=1654476 RepID=A0A9X3AD52_9PSEU|nr:histidine kinase [Umezawaea endophytica]MCS7475757.1 histidine kinase [Umezawaea endophytica]